MRFALAKTDRLKYRLPITMKPPGMKTRSTAMRISAHRMMVVMTGGTMMMTGMTEGREAAEVLLPIYLWPIPDRSTTYSTSNCVNRT